MKLDIILAGVGGQGILSIAYVLDNAALKKGYNVKQAEVHGMSQRGGAVQSHLRISNKEIYSDLIPLHTADLILAVEPLEALRYTEYLSPEGIIVASSYPEINIPDYPPVQGILDNIYSFPRHVVVDSNRLARAAGSSRAQNMVMLGVASKFFDLEEKDLLEFITNLFARKGEKIVTINHNAFKLGADTGTFFINLVENGLSSQDAFLITSKLSPEAISSHSYGEWIKEFPKKAEEIRNTLKALDEKETISGINEL